MEKYLSYLLPVKIRSTMALKVVKVQTHIYSESLIFLECMIMNEMECWVTDLERTGSHHIINGSYP